MMILFSQDDKKFYHPSRKVFCHLSRAWQDIEHFPANITEMSIIDAVKQLQSSSQRIRIPIGVIGTRTPTAEQYAMAEHVGRGISVLGFSVVCGGRHGIMEAVCKGVQEAGGVSIGLLPEQDSEKANAFVTVPIATGIGVARNVLISQSALCLVAVGGGYGTLSEIAFGFQFGKTVFGMSEKPYMEGMIMLQSVEELILNICRIVFNIEAIHESAALGVG